MADLVDKEVLKKFVPANALNAENFQELAGKATVEEVANGNAIFKVGDTDRKSVYLIEGEVEVKSADGKSIMVKAGTDPAKHPIANHQPRKHDAISKGGCKVTRIDADLMDILLTWDQLSGIEVDEIVEEEEEEAVDDDGDWMTRILQSKAFTRFPRPISNYFYAHAGIAGTDR